MLSVLIPAYNAERFIAAAIDSAASQKVDRGLEILVCDDGSTDRTAAIVRAKRAEIPGLKLFAQGRNQGVVAARNRLLSELDPDTQFVTFLDADDVLLDNAYRPGLDLLNGAPDLHMTYGTFYLVLTHLLSQGRPLAKDPRPVAGVSLSCGVFRRTLIDQIGLFDPSLVQGEDIDFLLRIAEVSDKIAMHDDPVFFYRRHAKNATRNTRALRSGLMRALLLHMKRRKANPALLGSKHLFLTTDPAILEAECQSIGDKRYSVVIPAYNAAKTIVETLQSILAQTVQPVQIIVVDDGSVDDTAQLAASVSPLVRVISTPNQGSGAATTMGIAAVDTPIFATLDADDLWLPNKIEVQLSHLLDNEAGLDGVLTKMTAFGDTHLKTATTESSGWSRSTLLMWVESYLLVGPVQDMGNGYGEMIDWFARANDAGIKFRLLDAPLAERRIHSDSLSFRSGQEQARDFLKVARLALERKRRQE